MSFCRHFLMPDYGMPMMSSKTKRSPVSALLLILLACGHPATVGQNTSSPVSKNGVDTAAGPRVIIAPPAVQADPLLNNGCWVRLTDKEAMPKKGKDILTIVGAIVMPSFETPSGVDWTHKADSLIVGPNASATVYSDKNYKGDAARLKGGQEVKDLNKELGFVEAIGSMRLECTA
jgi:hypothetical protein